MKLKLIRNLNSQRNKEQEDSFALTMNVALYFDINKVLQKIDAWKISNIKRLINSLKEIDNEIEIEFTKWNEQVEMLFNNLNCDLIQHFTLDDKIKNSIRNCDYKTIYSYLEEIRDDKNLKVEFLYYVAEVVKTNVNVSNIINEFVNKGISTLDVAIDSIMPLLFTGGLNE